MAEGKRNTKPSKPLGFIAKFYLISYNVIQVFGWSHVMLETIKYYLNGQQESLWESVNPSLLVFQTAAVLEVLNVMVGLVKSNLFSTGFQVLSRLMVVWFVFVMLPPSRESFGLPLLLFAWCVTEIIRYSFYALGLLNAIPHILTWCRYTFFYALYPIGVTGELTALLSTLGYVRKEKVLTYELPNALNFAFSCEYLIYFILLVYALVFPSLYMHMITLRKKVLGSEDIKTSSTKKAK